jgi:5-methylcytosine-specific restriction enzyme A
MPSAALRPCSEPRCPGYATYKGRCKDHAAAQERTRYNADTRHWYSSSDWRILRLQVLHDDPICVDCKQRPSTEVDHRVPHRGNRELFFDRSNVQGMCHTCHGRKTARGE